MAWIYLAESGESALPWLPGSDQSPTVKTIHMHKRSCFQECNPGNCIARQSGMTLEPCARDTFRAVLTLFTEDSPARTSVSLDMAAAWRESEAGYFLNLSDWLASADLSSFSWKTSQLSLFEGLTEFSWSSLRWGTTVDGRLYQPGNLEPRISENDGFYLPTPTAKHYGSNKGGGGGRESGEHRHSIHQMATLGLLPGHEKGALNREYLELVMGYREQWTVIAAWATPAPQRSTARHSSASLEIGG